LRKDIRSLQQSLGITTLYVTHDQEEALSISDQICVMHDGVVQQVDSAWTIYNRPANRFVATFVGSNNFLAVQRSASGQALVWGRPLHHAAAERAASVDGAVASARPEIIQINPDRDHPGIHVPAVVRQSMFTGRELQLTVDVQGHGPVEVLTPPSQSMVDLRPGATVQIGIRASDLLYFAPGETGERLP
jgi:iron(III) transport system ATP-binding protein